MAELVPVDYDPFKRSPFDSALEAEGVKGPLADIARSIYEQESSSGKNTKTSNAGAVGGMQIIPSTFKSVADEGWDINDPTHNARAGIRYLKELYGKAGGDPALTAAGYYGGPGGLEKARRGIAVSDPRNPNAPTTLEYGQQVAARLPKQKGVVQQAVEAVIPSANAAESGPTLVPVDFNPFERPSEDIPRVEIRGTSADEPEASEGPGIGNSIYRGANMLNPLGGVLNMLSSGDAVQDVKNAAGGLVRGAGSIGATALAPYDMARDALDGKGLSLESNRGRRAGMEGGLQELGVNTDAGLYQAGKLGAEVAGTAGVGNLLAAPARAAGLTKIANSLSSGGMTTGAPPATTLVEGAGNLAARAGGGAATGGASAGLVDPEDAGLGAMIGGATPAVTNALGAAGRGVGRSLVAGGVTDEVRSLAQRANDLGIDIPADRIVDSKPMNALASSLDYVPFSGRGATMNKMESQLNRALSRTFGQDSDNVTLALRKASDDLGKKFDTVLQNNKVQMDQQFLTDLADASNMATKELGSDGARVIQNQVDEIIAKAASGDIDGHAAYNIKRTLDRIGRRNSPEAYYALDLKGKLMDALNRSLGPQEAAAFKSVRQQYGNMLSLEKIAQNGAEGGVSIGRLANLKNINNPELQELADISAQFLKSREGAHGAAQRAYGTLGAAAAGYLGGPATVAGGVAAGRGANMLLNSGAARNAVMGQPQSGNLLRLLGEPELSQMFYRSAPVIGSSAQ